MAGSRFDPRALPEIAAWIAEINGKSNVVNFLSANVPISHVVAVLEIAWPEFVQIDECVIRARSGNPEALEGAVSEWLDKCSGNRSEVERTLNHLHLWDIFPTDADQLLDEALQWIASVLCNTWKSAAEQQYSGAHFRAIETDADNDYGPTVTIYRVRNDE